MNVPDFYRECAFPKTRPRVLDRQDREKADASADKAVKAHVKARDGGRCRIAGCKSGRIEGHHIVKRSQSKAKKFDADNIVSLCSGPGTNRHHQLADAGVLKFAGNPETNGFTVTDTRTGATVKARAVT